MDTCNHDSSDRHRVYVVDDDDGFRTGLVRVLNASGLAASGYRCIGEYLLAEPPDSPACILLDMWMPGPPGIELLHALAVHEYAPPVIFVTACSEVATSVHAMKSGAIDYLLKPITISRLLESVHKALALDARRRESRAEMQQIRNRYETLDERERKVLAGVVDGKLNKQLAVGLDTCERTIKVYRAKMMRKMHAATLTDLVKAARMLGITSPPTRAHEGRHAIRISAPMGLSPAQRRRPHLGRLS